MSSDAVRTISTVLAEASARATIAVALGALILAVARTRAPGVRHAVWTAITVAMLAMPLLPRAVPAVRVAMPPPIESWSGAASIFDSAGPAVTPAVPGRATAALPLSGSTTGSSTPATRGATADAPFAVDWRAALSIVYLAGLGASIVYIAAGWLAMTAIVRRSRPVALPDGSVVHESAIVAAPLTAGVFRPRIMLPLNWRTWPAQALSAVIAHERTHIQRRDPLIALVARINRCVFWFHPLAWWLEATLAASAEFACDEAASRTCRARADYAQVLVAIADGVRRNGGRLAWQGIAVSGNGQLKDRIERLLTAAPRPSTSRATKITVGCACVAAVGIAAACRPAAHAEGLKPDPAVAARLARQNEWMAQREKARAVTPERLAQLESAVSRNPEDLESRETLLRYYGDFQRTLDRAGVTARRAHVLWMIEHRPDRDLAGWTRLPTNGEDPNPDPEGYALAKRLWLAQVAKPGATVQVLSDAGHFLEIADKPLAEAAYLKAEERETDRIGRARLARDRGRLYALALMGADASMPNNVLRHVSRAEAHGPYAAQVRRTLEETRDPEVLTGAGRTLLVANQFNTMGETAGSIDFDVRAAGLNYLERAVAIDPNATVARLTVQAVRVDERSRRVLAGLTGVSADDMPGAIAALPETDQLDVLWRLIGDSYRAGEALHDNKHDLAGARAAWRRLALYADRAWSVGPRHPEHPMAASAMFDAHIYLGTVALYDGDVRTAVAHLKAAPDTVTGNSVRYNGDPAGNRLVRYLLKAGERDAVIEYCERLASINTQESKTLMATAQAVRAGRMPEWYQLLTDGEAAR